MVNIGGSFDSNTIKPRESFEPVVRGWYAMIIADSSAETSKDGKSKHIKLTFEYDERYHPELKGRKVWETLNLWHHNPQTVKIASATLSSIARATGVLVFSDTNSLHGKSLAVKLRVDDGGGKYDPSNRPSDYDTVQNRASSFVPPNGSSSPSGIAAPPGAAQPPRAQSAPTNPPAASAPVNPPQQSEGPPWLR